jgi:PAS domain S-box-containing protein
MEYLKAKELKVNSREIYCSTPVVFPKRMIEALGRLQEKTNSIAVGSIYIYDLLEQCTLCASSSIAAMLGYTAEAIHEMGPLGLANLIHSDDLNRVAEHYQRFTTLQPEEVITIGYRMKRADGTWCWLRSQDTPLVQAVDGFPLQILGILQDMSLPATRQIKRPTVLGKSFKRRHVVPKIATAFTKRRHQRLLS